MADKILLTEIPTAEDLKDAEAMAKILAENEKANLEAEVAELTDFCIKMILRNRKDWTKTASSYSRDAIHAVRTNFSQQGIRITYDPIHGFSFDTNVRANLTIPSPEGFADGAELPVFPVSILNNHQTAKYRLLNKCLEEIRQQKNSHNKAVNVDRKNISDETAVIVADILRSSGWEVEVTYPEDIHSYDKVSPSMAAAASRKYIKILLPV